MSFVHSLYVGLTLSRYVTNYEEIRRGKEYRIFYMWLLNNHLVIMTYQ